MRDAWIGDGKMKLIVNPQSLDLAFWRELRDTYNPPWELRDFRNKNTISVSEARAREIMDYVRSFPSFDYHIVIQIT